MSKKINNLANSGSSYSPANAHAEEYRYIRNDLIRVIVVNVIIFGLVIAVYLTDKQSGYLQRFYNQIF